MSKVLVTAHLGRHFRIFGQSDYKVLLDKGYEVHIAANFQSEIDHFECSNIVKHQIDFDRNPFSMQNLKALKQLKRLFEEEKFELIHCQSPSGGAITRLAAKETRKRGTKVIYTAHGLHFFQGAPKKNWIMYYNFEKFLGRYTDGIIAINEEDYKSSKEKLKIKNVHHVHGVGIDLNRFKNIPISEKLLLRKKHGFSEKSFILIYVGELSYRKNQIMIIEAIAMLKDKIPNIKLLLIGTGILREQYEKKSIELGVEQFVEFLGYRNDISELMALSDIGVSTSRQEGLPVNVMEGMASGLPMVVTNCRGNRDLINDGENGYVVSLTSKSDLADKIYNLYESNDNRKKFSKANENLILRYSLQNIQCEMSKLYESYIMKNGNFTTKDEK
ncbi:glycosyltransferase family 4 protein [Paraclostridium dentum]|uniref:glycosyltransferase family 4 protein n=1 Tax=Paraclostridium dentum TaxID=2662455 RepID=UPI0014747D36|nr:glycosyltransferase family 4 protein [Paraclostridium dentum]